MHLQVLKLSGPLFSGEAREVLVPTTVGHIAILDHHQPLISVVRPERPITIVAPAGTRQEITSGGGFLIVEKDHTVKLLLD